MAAQELNFDVIGSVIGTHVRRGALIGVSKKKRRQKAVDILLAVDMMTFAVRQIIKRAVLLTGDADFEPLVDSLIQMGLFVAVSGDASHTSKDLIRAADSFIPLHFNDYFHFSKQEYQSSNPLPVEGGITYRPGFYEGELCDRGVLEDGSTVIISFPQIYRAYVAAPESTTAKTFDEKSPDRLRLYIELVFGPCRWQSKS